MEKTTGIPPVSGLDPENAFHLPASLAGQGWMVWLRQRAGARPDVTRSGLDREREAHAFGRCLFVLPNDGGASSWCRRGSRAGLLYGHLLNREALRKRLEVPATPAPSDAELLLAAYEAWGCDAARELEGAYAAVVWDEADETLLCIRDAIGTMPVFYSQTAAGLVISTDIWTVLRHPDVPRDINRLVIAEHLLSRLSRVEETSFAHVRRLPGAHYLRARGSEFTTVRYWDPLPPPGGTIDWIDPEEIVTFPALLRQSVTSCMALGPTAISLSAGIDSVSLSLLATEVAAEQGWEQPHGLGLHFAGHGCDESAGQASVARTLQMPFRLLSFSECLGGRPLLEVATELSPSFPSTLDNTWQPLFMQLTEVARSRGMRVLLTGTGGDEWLCVTPLLAADLLRAGDIGGLWHLYWAFLRSYRMSPFTLARNMLWRYGVTEIARDAAYRHVPGWVARRRPPVQLPDWLAPDPELHGQLCERLAPPPPQPGVDSVYVRELRPTLQHPLVMMELEEYYYRARGRGISYLHPYWTRPIVEFLLRTPPRALNDGGRSKGIVRQMVAERFPELQYGHHKKIYIGTYYHQMVSEQWAPIWRRMAPDSALAAAGIVNMPRLEQAMHAIVARRPANIVQWLFSEAWLRGQS